MCVCVCVCGGGGGGGEGGLPAAKSGIAMRSILGSGYATLK